MPKPSLGFALNVWLICFVGAGTLIALAFNAPAIGFTTGLVLGLGSILLLTRSDFLLHIFGQLAVVTHRLLLAAKPGTKS